MVFIGCLPPKLSILNSPLSIFNSQLSTLNFQLSTKKCPKSPNGWPMPWSRFSAAVITRCGLQQSKTWLTAYGKSASKAIFRNQKKNLSRAMSSNSASAIPNSDIIPHRILTNGRVSARYGSTCTHTCPKRFFRLRKWGVQHFYAAYVRVSKI